MLFKHTTEGVLPMTADARRTLSSVRNAADDSRDASASIRNAADAAYLAFFLAACLLVSVLAERVAGQILTILRD